jgi:hypothetical protein
VPPPKKSEKEKEKEKRKEKKKTTLIHGGKKVAIKMAPSRILAGLALALTAVLAEKPPQYETVPLSEEDVAKGLTEQVRTTTSQRWFTYGSSAADEMDGEAELLVSVFLASSGRSSSLVAYMARVR